MGLLPTGGFMYNMETPVSATGKTVFYSFGGYNYKSSDAFAYTRNWSGRPDRFPVTSSGVRIDVALHYGILPAMERYIITRIYKHIYPMSRWRWA